MKIKKLSMLGFKSFMDRIEINFPTGISAVVGPNGCGKSNIVDAIRWAMGEQSAKQLRGRQMEDVIFNGAGEQKALGMAEVSISFENGIGAFPPGFSLDSEISVTRRLYRSGESEYMINNVPCRLKDIQEIFMDTGLGNRAYSIIGQGRIGSIIDQKPEETRAMLEEAAGITKYKKKVDEALRKLERTKANLDRLEDILSEVKRQMKALKRQAAKARRYKAIGQEVRRLEVVLNANLYQELQEESKNKGRSADDLIQDEMARSSELSSLQAQIQAIQLTRDEMEERVSQVRNDFLRIKEAYNRKEAHLESLSREKELQLDLEKRLKSEKEDMHQRLGRLAEERNSLTGQIEKLKQRAQEIEDEIVLLEKRLKGRRELLIEAKDEYERARNRVTSGETKEAGLNQESGYLTKRISEVTDRRIRLEREKEDFQKRIVEITQKVGQKSEAREAYHQNLARINEDLLAEKERYETLEGNRKETEMALHSTEAKLQADQSRLASLRSLTDNFEGYKLAVRTIMRAPDLKAKSEGRILGLVADIMQVPPEYEIAVEAVLADKLQYIIVQNQEDGKEAIDYLKIKEKGRSSFVPLMDLVGEKRNGHGNGLPLLMDFIAVSENYKSMMETLIGNVALAENLDQAIIAWRSNGKDQCLVTPEGDMVDQRGIISGGRLTKGSQGLLTRKREITELEKAIRIKEEELIGFKEKSESLLQEIEQKKSQLQTLEQEKSDSQIQINDLDNMVFRLSHELDQLEKGLTKVRDELEQSDNEQIKHKEALDRIKEQLRQCEETKKQEREYLLLKEVELKEIEEEVDQGREEIESKKMEARLAKEEERGLIREIERIDRDSEEAQQKVKQFEQDIINGQTRYQECQEKEESTRFELEEFYERLAMAEKKVGEAELEKNQQSSLIREEENRMEKMRSELEELKERINRARMEQSELKYKMEALIETIRDKYNMDLTAVCTEYLEEDFSAPEVRDQIEHQKNIKERLGEVNLTAIQEHEALKERFTFLSAQREDMLRSIESINQAISKLNRTCRERFINTYVEVDQKLKEVFPILFNGGEAGLRLLDEAKPLESGVLVEVRPPGKKLSHMGLLSGGEKALVAMALLFAIYLIKPSPFCLLDEVDAPLDEANIDRFNDLLHEIKKHSQILLVTHNRRSMEIVDSLYGVTMENAGISKMVAVNLKAQNLN